MRARMPRVDVLVNNLGIFEPKPFEEIADDDWLRFFETQRAERRAADAAHYLPGMRERNGAASSSSRASRPCRSRPR